MIEYIITAFAVGCLLGAWIGISLYRAMSRTAFDRYFTPKKMRELSALRSRDIGEIYVHKDADRQEHGHGDIRSRF